MVAVLFTGDHYVSPATLQEASCPTRKLAMPGSSPPWRMTYGCLAVLVLTMASGAQATTARLPLVYSHPAAVLRAGRQLQQRPPSPSNTPSGPPLAPATRPDGSLLEDQRLRVWPYYSYDTLKDLSFQLRSGP